MHSAETITHAHTHIAMLHTQAAGVLDGEAVDWGAHLCSTDDAYDMIEGDTHTLVCRVKIAVGVCMSMCVCVFST